jgi:hypothetical protein
MVTSEVSQEGATGGLTHWATKRLGPADVPVLIEMLGDEESTARIAASGLLTTSGDAAEPAL